MTNPTIDGNKVILSKTYRFGEEEIKELTFQKITAKDIGEVPMWDKQRIKDYYPLICSLTGITPRNFEQLERDDILKTVEMIGFLLGT